MIVHRLLRLPHNLKHVGLLVPVEAPPLAVDGTPPFPSTVGPLPNRAATLGAALFYVFLFLVIQDRNLLKLVDLLAPFP